MLLQVKEYKADLVSLKEQLKQAAAGASEGDAARAELGLGDNYYSTSGAVKLDLIWCSETGPPYAVPPLSALGQGHYTLEKQPVHDTHLALLALPASPEWNKWQCCSRWLCSVHPCRYADQHVRDEVVKGGGGGGGVH